MVSLSEIYTEQQERDHKHVADYGRALEFHHAVIDQVIIIFLRIPSPLVAGNSVYEHPVHAEDRCQIGF